MYQSNPNKTLIKVKRHWELYLLVLLPVLYLLVFKYIPMIGVQIAFKDFNVIKGIWGSQFVGLKHFHEFFASPNFWLLIKEYDRHQLLFLDCRLSGSNRAGIGAQ